MDQHNGDRRGHLEDVALLGEDLPGAQAERPDGLDLGQLALLEQRDARLDVELGHREGQREGNGLVKLCDFVGGNSKTFLLWFRKEHGGRVSIAQVVHLVVTAPDRLGKITHYHRRCNVANYRKIACNGMLTTVLQFVGLKRF